MSLAYNHLKLHMTFSCAMHASVKIYILNYFIHSAGVHVIPKPCHIQSTHAGAHAHIRMYM
jgi:hypothetical protein